jgi:hypothetical protein
MIATPPAPALMWSPFGVLGSDLQSTAGSIQWFCPRCPLVHLAGTRRKREVILHSDTYGYMQEYSWVHTMVLPTLSTSTSSWNQKEEGGDIAL